MIFFHFNLILVEFCSLYHLHVGLQFKNLFFPLIIAVAFMLLHILLIQNYPAYQRTSFVPSLLLTHVDPSLFDLVSYPCPVWLMSGLLSVDSEHMNDRPISNGTGYAKHNPCNVAQLLSSSLSLNPTPQWHTKRGCHFLIGF